MKNREGPKWKKFEELVAKVQREVSPEAIVTLNDKIRGKITRTVRQVDISINISVHVHACHVANH